MPTIADFLGIKITIFYRDHPPMYVHVTYQDYQSRFSITSGDLLDGSIPQRQKRIVKNWILANSTL